MSKRKTVLFNLLQTQDTLNKLSEADFPASVTFELMRIAEKINEQLGYYQKTLQQTLTKHGATNELLDEPNKDREKYNKVIQEIEPVLNKEIVFDNVSITREAFKECSTKFSVNDLLSIKWLFTEVQEVKEISEEEQTVE